MREEIAAAVGFVTRIIKLSNNMPLEKVEEFSKTLSATLIDKFRNHWYNDKPTKGQGYRCIRINPSEPIDPVLEKAASDCGLHYIDLNLPKELTLWVDPNEVCCRFGESHGEFCQLAMVKADGNLETQANTINIESLVKQQQIRFTMNLNIVAMRTSAIKLKALAMKNAVNQQQFQQKSSFYHNNQHQQNLYNNHNTHNDSVFVSRSFHYRKHPKNIHSNHNGSVNSFIGTHGSKGSSGSNRVGDSDDPAIASQNKDRSHWVNEKHYSPNQIESMHLSPN